MKIKYPILFQNSEAGYIISFPDITDCGPWDYIPSYGETEENLSKEFDNIVSKVCNEAAMNIAKKIEQGEKIPKPWSNSVSSGKITDVELNIGKFLPRDPDNMVSVELSLEKELYEKLVKLANEQNITLDELVEELLFEQMLDGGYYWD